MPTVAALALGKVPLFSGLSEHDLEQLATASQERHYAKGSVIFHEGDSADYLLVVTSGRAKVILQSQRGQEVILTVVEPPDVLGHVALLDGAPRSATVMALDALEARRLGRDAFLDLIEKNRSLLERLLRHLAASLRATNEQVRTALMFDIHGQVIRALIKRAREDDGTRIIVRPRPTQDEIAQMIGRNRETVNRAIRELKKGDYLVSDRNAYFLKKERLTRYWRG